MLRALVAAAALLVPSATTPATVDISPAAIVQVICPTATGYSAGTAFRIGHGLMLSVNHVTHYSRCTIDDAPVKVSYVAPDADFSMLGGGEGSFLKIDCGGFVRGRKYLAIGYARGLPVETVVPLIGTGKSSGGLAVLIGIFTVVPGMSGGPIVDAETGAVVGTVNTYDFERGLSGSVELKGTPVCKPRIA